MRNVQHQVEVSVVIRNLAISCSCMINVMFVMPANFISVIEVAMEQNKKTKSSRRTTFMATSHIGITGYTRISARLAQEYVDLTPML